MSKLTPKPSEVLQAQIATFAAERARQHEDKTYIFNNLGSLATESVGDIVRTTESGELDWNKNDERFSVPASTVRTVVTAQDYIEYLRSVGGSSYEPIQGRADMLKAYAAFTPAVSKLKEELASLGARNEHPAFLGDGFSSMVFSVERRGKDYAARLPNNKSASSHVIDRHVIGAFLGKGIPHLEQVVAASYEDGVTIAEVMPGVHIGNLSVGDIKQITGSQLSELVDTVVTAYESGIEIDHKPSNFFYDPKEGFGIVDYHPARGIRIAEDRERGKSVGWLSVIINNAGFYGKGPRPKDTPKDYANDLEFLEANLGVLKKLKPIVESRLNGEDLRQALATINFQTKETTESVGKYSDPQWVAAQLSG
jgi:hypothetical protein